MPPALRPWRPAKRASPRLLGEGKQGLFTSQCRLRRTQEKDGSWRGAWGVQFICGTLFRISASVAEGARRRIGPASGLPVVAASQRDGRGWGERHRGCQTGQYVERDESLGIQTAWALSALKEAGKTNWTAISRGVRFLINKQRTDGTWPRQDMAGKFFRSALPNYIL